MTDPWPIHTVVFDLDDTLFAENEYVLSGFTAAGQWLSETHAVAGFAAEAVALFHAGSRGTIFDEVLRKLAPGADSSWIGELVRVYRAHVPTISLLPEAAQCITWARRSFNLGLLTDGYAAVQQKKIEALGIASVIECRVMTDELGGREFWKPNPEGFRRIMAFYPGESGGYVYIADNPRKDFIAPRALGWKTVRIRRPGGEHAKYEAAPHEAADRDIQSLAELRSFILPASRT